MNVAGNTLFIIASNLLVRSVGLFTFFLSRRWLGPEMTGVWSLVQALLGYVLAFHSGVVLGAERDIPYWTGKNDPAKADLTRRQMFSMSLVESAGMGLLVAGFAATVGSRYRPELAHGFYWIAAYCVLFRLSECFLVTLRAQHRFFLVGRIMGAFAFFDLALAALLVRPWGFQGQCAAFAASLLLRVTLYAFIVRRLKLFSLRWHFERATLAPLMVVGLPLMANNFLWQWFVSIDSILVAKIAGVTALGYYSVALSAGRPLEDVPAAFNTVVFPKMMENFGMNDDPRLLGHNLLRYIEAAVYFLLPLALAVMFFGMPPLVKMFLPDFAESIPLFRILLVGGLFSSLTHMPVQIFVARKKTSWVFGVTLGACVLKTAAAWFLAPHGLTAVAAGVALAHAAFFAVFVVIAFRWTLGLGALRTLLFLLIGVAYSFAVLFAVDTILGPAAGAFEGELLRAGQAIAVSLLLMLPLFWKADRDLGLRDQVRYVLAARR